MRGRYNLSPGGGRRPLCLIRRAQSTIEVNKKNKKKGRKKIPQTDLGSASRPEERPVIN